jgi:hypothetical protein
MKAFEIEEKIKKLPEHIMPEVNDFIDFLLSKYCDQKNDTNNFQFDWEGGLSKLKNKFTSIELQHKVSEWR